MDPEEYVAEDGCACRPDDGEGAEIKLTRSMGVELLLCAVFMLWVWVAVGNIADIWTGTTRASGIGLVCGTVAFVVSLASVSVLSAKHPTEKGTTFYQLRYELFGLLKGKRSRIFPRR